MNSAILYAVSLCGVALLAPPARGQLTFSIDWKGPTIAQNDSGTASPITDGDILTFGPGAPGLGILSPPAVYLSGRDIGLSAYASCSGHLPGQPCGIEVDAISQGQDESLPKDSMGREQYIWFSVDEWAEGLPQPHIGPTVATESGSVGDASADIFVAMGVAAGPLGPGSGPGRHVGVFDGNGQRSSAPSNRLYPGIGLLEPNPANTSLPNLGDNLDALDIATTFGFPPGGYYFSVDSGFTDPLSAANNSDTATPQMVSGADVLHIAVPAPVGVPVIFATANSLGLDLVGGPSSDDVDTLILVENGNGHFDRSRIPYDWENGSRDMLLFSVRRGSAVIGRPDSHFGAPIEPGDILTTPRPAQNGGVSFFPAIMFSAESLGLRTNRTHGALFGDDIDAGDISSSPCFDCNNNGVEDAVDIATGSSSDSNDNGIPDECEVIEEYCHCERSSAPCANGDPEAGCANSTGTGAHLYFTGTQSVATDDLILHTDGLPPNRMGLFYMGGGQSQLPFGDGLRCVGAGDAGIFRYVPSSSGAAGVLTEGPGLAAYACVRFGPSGCITPGSTWDFQCWYRDLTGPCASGFNTSNGIEVAFGP